jgi:putative Holliday junction resolvase
MRILALDVGERRIGVAAADEATRVALPVTAVERREPSADLEAIGCLIREQGAETVVVGLPISMNGSLGPQAQQVKAFAEELSSRLSVPVEYWDERLSTVEAERRLRSAAPSRRQAGRKRQADKGRRDALAAAIVLQAYLDHRAGHKPGPAFES